MALNKNQYLKKIYNINNIKFVLLKN